MQNITLSNCINPYFKTLMIGLISIALIPLHIDATEIEEIIVKGSYREISLEKNDGSLFVLNEEQLKAEPIKHLEQLSFLIPNLNFALSDGRPRYFQIRGIGEQSGYEGTPNSSVGLMIDDIDFSGQGGISSSFDMEQIEVHRGPQGSRMGANALAGMIYMRAKDPTEVFSGLSELMVGSDGIRSTGLAFGGPFKDNPDAQYRISIRQDKSDGFRENSYLNRDDTTGKDELTARFKLNYQLNESTDLKLLFQKSDFEAMSDSWTTDGSLNTLSDKPGFDSQDSNSYGMRIYHEREGVSFQSLTSGTNSDILISYDADWSNPIDSAPYTYDFFSETLRSRKSFNQEFRLLSDPLSFESNQTFAWVLGAYYLDLSERNDITDLGTYINPSSTRPPYIKNVTGTRNYDSKNKALFGSFDYLLSETLTLSFGMRWEDWEANYSDTFGEQFNPDDQMLGGKLSLTKAWSDETNVYASVGRGYKSGGFNLGTGFSDELYADALIYDPEYLWNYEVGINRQFSGSDTNLDAVIFYSDRKDQQVMASTQVDPNDPNTFTFLTQNAASGKNYGMELSIKSQPIDALNVYASIGLLKTKVNYLDLTNAQNGRAQAHAPERTFAIGMRWYPLESLYLGFDVNGKSDFYYSDSHDNQSSSYTLANLVMGYQMEQWNYEFWIRNLFDEYYSLRGFYFGNVPPTFPRTLFERQGDLRHMGISIRYEF